MALLTDTIRISPRRITIKSLQLGFVYDPRVVVKVETIGVGSTRIGTETSEIVRVLVVWTRATTV